MSSMLRIGDKVLLRPRSPAAWAYSGKQADIVHIGQTSQRMGPEGSMAHAVHEFVTVYTVTLWDEHLENIILLSLSGEEIVLWNGLETMLELV